MQESGGIFFMKKGWTMLTAVASSDFWIVIVVVMGHTSKMDLASALSQAASRIVVLETTAREEVRGKVSERGHRLHSLSRHRLVTLSRRQSNSYRPLFAYQIAYASEPARITITITTKAYNMLHLSQGIGRLARKRKKFACR